MDNSNWEEIRTAGEVARLGTVSAAAKVLGVHHATVIRHIDALEARLGVKLFQRHARGYTSTDAGRDVLQVASVTYDQIHQLEARIRGQKDEPSGELIISIPPPGSGPLVALTAARFQNDFPNVTLRVSLDPQKKRLEYGEAHIAIRAGSAPKEPDNIGQHLMTYQVRLCAAKSYVDQNGMPDGILNASEHRFICDDQPPIGPHFLRWLHSVVPAKQIVLRTDDRTLQERAVIEGVGIGFVGDEVLQANPNLIEIMAPHAEWKIQLWVVTHVDMHRTTKVQGFLKLLKDVAEQWDA